jgi:hypothetical protein
MKLSDLADVQSGYPFRSRLKHDPCGDIAVVQMKDIEGPHLRGVDGSLKTSLPNLKDHHLLQPGDLLFRSRGSSNGATEVVGEVGPAVLAAPLLLIRPHQLLPSYLCWFINTSSTRAYLRSLSKGTSVQMISIETVRNLDVPLPGIEVQQRIVAAAVLIERERVLLTEIAKLRNTLIEAQLMRRAKDSWRLPG